MCPVAAPECLKAIVADSTPHLKLTGTLKVDSCRSWQPASHHASSERQQSHLHNYMFSFLGTPVHVNSSAFSVTLKAHTLNLGTLRLQAASSQRGCPEEPCKTQGSAQAPLWSGKHSTITVPTLGRISSFQEVARFQVS